LRENNRFDGSRRGRFDRARSLPLRFRMGRLVLSPGRYKFLLGRDFLFSYIGRGRRRLGARRFHNGGASVAIGAPHLEHLDDAAQPGRSTIHARPHVGRHQDVDLPTVDSLIRQADVLEGRRFLHLRAQGVGRLGNQSDIGDGAIEDLLQAQAKERAEFGTAPRVASLEVALPQPSAGDGDRRARRGDRSLVRFGGGEVGEQIA